MREAFQKFDVGNKNCLTEDELRFCLTATGDHPLSDDEFREVLSRAQFDEVSNSSFKCFYSIKMWFSISAQETTLPTVRAAGVQQEMNRIQVALFFMHRNICISWIHS